MEALPDCDPENLTTLYVQQWLSEKGYTSALTALERESKILYDDTKLQKGAQLMHLVWDHMETALADHVDDGVIAQRIEEEALLRGGNEDFAKTLLCCIEGVHTSSIICVRIWPDREVILTGAGDGYVRMMEISGLMIWETHVGAGGVLCMELYIDSFSAFLAVGSMDGSLSVIDANHGTLLYASKPHNKYLVRVLWSLEGNRIITASHDQSIGVHHWNKLKGPLGNDPDKDPDQILSFSSSVIKQLHYTGPVQDIALLKESQYVAVAVGGTNYIRLLDLSKLQVPEKLVNVNSAGDDHVSFTVRHLALSPDGRFLLASTDTPRLILLRTSDWSISRSFFATAEQFHIPVAAWHPDGHYIYVSAVGGQVWVFHVGNCKNVAKIPAHKINVRDFVYDSCHKRLVTCSFDKTIKLFIE